MSTAPTPRLVKGFADLYEPESSVFTLLENTARRVFGAYGYKELRTPILEYTELFTRGIGTETDVVQKEMFTFPDRKGRSLTMRPEATAGVIRSYIENNLHAREASSKLFTYGPMFRYERPQKGRMRQFHQLNCECLGVDEPQLDAEVMLMLMLFFSELGLTDLSLELNTLGCRECRPAYKQILTVFLESLDRNSLCEDCQRRMTTNPLRVLDCKVPGCKAQTENAPKINEHVCQPCADHFSAVTEALETHSLAFNLNPRLVRGLDYYSRTTFEVVTTSIGAQGTVAGGGRYDGLVAQLGGPDVPGVGFGCGMERVALMLAGQMAGQAVHRPDFFIALLTPAGANQALALAQTLRERGLSGETAFGAKSLKSQMRHASRMGARYCLMLGDTELADRLVVIKDLDSGAQVSLPFTGLADWADSVK